MNLFLVRHGQTAWNAARRYQGQSDVPLNSVGVWQAQQVARRLAGQAIERVVSSDLQRAQATAAALGHLPVTTDACWREMSFGIWEGLTHADIMAQDDERYQQWLDNPVAFAPPEGESLTAVGQRVWRGWQKIAESAVKTAVLVAHGGSLKLLLCQLLGLPLTAYWQFKLDHASLSHIQIYPPGAILMSLNETHHLQKRAQ